jgi:hypothetical protein
MASTVIGLLVGIIIAVPGTIMITRRYLKPSTEKAFYALSLIPIALIYIGFTFYYGDVDALPSELIGVLIFSIFSLTAQFISLKILPLAYILHAAWDVFHEIFIKVIADNIVWTQVPMGYAAFCLAYDIIIAYYVYISIERWQIKEGEQT